MAKRSRRAQADTTDVTAKNGRPAAISAFLSTRRQRLLLPYVLRLVVVAPIAAAVYLLLERRRLRQPVFFYWFGVSPPFPPVLVAVPFPKH